jgi:hypothetical protein
MSSPDYMDEIVTPVCRKCGSSDVYGSAILKWNQQEQFWMIDEPFEVDLETATYAVTGNNQVTSGNCRTCEDITVFDYKEEGAR